MTDAEKAVWAAAVEAVKQARAAEVVEARVRAEAWGAAKKAVSQKTRKSKRSK